MKQFKVGILGATGAVGREMMKILEERKFPVAELRPIASARSAGTKLPFNGGEVEVVAAADSAFLKFKSGSLQCDEHISFRQMHPANIVQLTVIALRHHTVHGAGRHANILVLFQHVFGQSVQRSSRAERIGHQNRRFDIAEFLDLNQSGTFAESVDYGNGCRNLFAEEIPRMREDRCHARMNVSRIVFNRNMSDFHAGNIRNQVPFSFFVFVFQFCFTFFR